MVEVWLQQLQGSGLIEVYPNPDGGRSASKGASLLYRIVNFLRHQYIQKPTHSHWPRSPQEVEQKRLQCVCAYCVGLNPKRSTRNLYYSYQSTTGALREGSHTTTRVREQSDSHTIPLLPVVEVEVGVEVEGGGGDGSIGSPLPNMFERGKGFQRETNSVENVENSESSPQESKTNPNPFKINGKDKVKSEEPPGDRPDRRSRLSEYRQIAVKIAAIIDIPNDDNTIAAMVSAMWRVSTTAKLTEVAAGNALMQRAALAKQEERPESWQVWFDQVEQKGTTADPQHHG